jgi:hypothetical protein
MGYEVCVLFSSNARLLISLSLFSLKCSHPLYIFRLVVDVILLEQQLTLVHIYHYNSKDFSSLGFNSLT